MIYEVAFCCARAVSSLLGEYLRFLPPCEAFEARKPCITFLILIYGVLGPLQAGCLRRDGNCVVCEVIWLTPLRTTYAHILVYFLLQDVSHARG